ncbi:secondary thiamine-phosphate synthase enzyme YjbQ [Pyrococcus abyssi]|uniref:YjbQ family protein n=1 Tax=Pyrococcus abyssi (strain GE5 / Orsay) TaxID=272844 RepID=Q9UYT8_PYRAB|nr:secondary thiamine-phosphate synthase enzyme YjbQ [Pyrococcus abyssi]CAB50324.1 Hypothetical protein PAB0941 [Pyrococcus abyssi GE5]CCE70864.1 TPA: hypothetical protein PAB0941 [Pyrococcus abyssi GE5]
MLRSIKVRTSKEFEIVDITDEVEKIVRESNVKSGLVVVFTRHTTTALTINENESGLKRDLEELLGKLVPKGMGYMHDRIDNNAHSHLRGILIGPSLTIPVEDGRLLLGTWQSILFIELDGPRTREVYVKVCEC